MIMKTINKEKTCETCGLFIFHRVDKGCPTGRCDLEGTGYTTTIKDVADGKCGQWRRISKLYEEQVEEAKRRC
jgi:hypothetical protein